MTRYILQRLLLLIPVLLGITLMVFIVMAMAPGDPAQQALGESATPELVAQLRKEWGLDDPLHVQYGRFLLNAAHGDLGRSFRTKSPVVDELSATWPATAELTIAALLVSLLISIPAGIISATKPYSIFDNLSMLTALMGLSMPVFWVGLVLMYFFAYQFHLFPTSGRSGIPSLVLPAVTLGAASAAIIARMLRSTLLDVLREDYVRTARAKGLSGRTVVIRHAMKNAFIPVVTVIALQMGMLLGGSVIVETVFGWPGVGRLMITSILARDAPMVRGTVLLVASVFVFVNLAVDVIYAYLDPRIRYS